MLCSEKDYLVSVSESLVQNADDMIKVFQLTGNKELVEMPASRRFPAHDNSHSAFLQIHFSIVATQ